MWIAQQKRKENVAEYILYMWQIEDIIRSYNMDLLKIEEELISQYKLQEAEEDALFEWYKDLVNQMRTEGVANKGHLAMTTEILNQLFFIHQNLLNDKKDYEYTQQFKKCEPIISDLKEKSGVGSLNDLEICFNGLYGKFIMKLQQKEISPETEAALKEISKMISFLVKEYNKAFSK